MTKAESITDNYSLKLSNFGVLQFLNGYISAPSVLSLKRSMNLNKKTLFLNKFKF